jgi:hypothetical protein
MSNSGHYEESYKSLRNRAGREFYTADNDISEEHARYLKSLVDIFPFNNHIYDGMLSVSHDLV